MCARYGDNIISLRHTQRNKILDKAGFNIDTMTLDTSSSIGRKNAYEQARVNQNKLIQHIKQYNSKLEATSPKINSIACLNNMEVARDRCVYICIDEVWVSSQVDKRKYDAKAQDTKLISIRKRDRFYQELSANQKKIVNRDALKDKFFKVYDNGELKTKSSKWLIHSVATIEWDNKRHIITELNLNELLLSVLAFLIENSLLETRRLMFFADGAINLRNAIKRVFSFTQYSIILDWYHLSSNMADMINAGLKTTKEDKETIIKALLSYLWVYNYQNAIKLLKELVNSPKVKDKNKLNDAIKYIKNHIHELTCYVLRNELGLPNSSSSVEKANDVIISQRQKHNGMSFTIVGSATIAQLSAAYQNNQLDNYLKASSKLKWFKYVEPTFDTEECSNDNDPEFTLMVA